MPDATFDSLIQRQFVRDDVGSICHERQSTRTYSGGKVCYECAMDYEQEWKGVAIQTNGDDNFAAASIVKFSLAKTDIQYINPLIRVF